jgi:hypothetical protein
VTEKEWPAILAWAGNPSEGEFVIPPSWHPNNERRARLFWGYIVHGTNSSRMDSHLAPVSLMLNDLRSASPPRSCSIGLGVGANAVIFSFADGILFRPLPVPDASRVGNRRTRTPTGAFGGVSDPDYPAFRDHSRSFAGRAASGLMPAANLTVQPLCKVRL